MFCIVFCGMDAVFIWVSLNIFVIFSFYFLVRLRTEATELVLMLWAHVNVVFCRAGCFMMY
jgi:hypothetical protein